MIEVTVQVIGLREVEDALAEAGPKLAKRALRKALKAGADIFVQRAKERAPILQKATTQRRPGELRDAIDQKITLSAKEEAGTARVGLAHDQRKHDQSPAVYGLFVEFGSIHNVAHPYMRPGYDTANREALDVFTEEIKKGVATLDR